MLPQKKLPGKSIRALTARQIVRIINRCWSTTGHDAADRWEVRRTVFAIVETGGKQYRVSEGDLIQVEKLAAAKGETVTLDRVLMIGDGDQVRVGKPVVEGAQVRAKVVDQDRGPKIIVFKYKPKIRYRVKSGHRQSLTHLRIEQIVG